MTTKLFEMLLIPGINLAPTKAKIATVGRKSTTWFDARLKKINRIINTTINNSYKYLGKKYITKVFKSFIKTSSRPFLSVSLK